MTPEQRAHMDVTVTFRDAAFEPIDTLQSDHSALVSELKDAKAKLDAATPGPWTEHDSKPKGKAMAICDRELWFVAEIGKCEGYSDRMNRNAEAICVARNIVPGLLAKVIELLEKGE